MDKEIHILYKKIKKIGFEKVLEEKIMTREMLIKILFSMLQMNFQKQEKKIIRTIIKENIASQVFNEQKLGIIADTHIGSKKENWQYIEAAYETFHQEKITSILHLGDIFEGYPVHYKQNIKEFQKKSFQQIESFTKNYPKGFQTFGVLGNHDDMLNSVKINLQKEIATARPDFTIVGRSLAYIKCQDKLISLKHPVFKRKNELLNYYGNCYLHLFGHSHLYELERINAKLKVPTLSDSHPGKKVLDAKDLSGFLILEFLEQNILVHRYIFEQENPKLLLTKSLKDGILGN